MSTIPQNEDLLKNLFNRIDSRQHALADQERVRERMEMLVMAELFTFGSHPVTQ